MKYVTALIPLLLLAILDLALICTFIGMIVIADCGPYSYKFACKVWT